MARNRTPAGDAGRNKSSWLTRGFRLCGDCPLLTSALGEAFKNSASSPFQRSLVLLFYFFDCTGRNIGQTMNQRVSNLTAGLCCYNAALLGAVMPALLLGTGSTMGAGAVWLSMILGAVCTVLISNSLGNSFGSLKPAMPIFTLPFNLVALFSYVCLLVWQQPGPASSPAPPPEISGLKDWWCSALVLVGMFVSSPILALAGFLGSLIATCFAVMVSPSLYAAAYSGIYGYNGFLAACSVGYFFVPCWRSVVVATCNATLATAVQVALAYAFSEDCYVGVGSGECIL
ncbi:hypothetical protein B566_EDAN017661 [Ephemera danica]|nr:hypothetical protein B566_EDAN017661 [Ephemera danica]